jgi:hypothetical protein
MSALPITPFNGHAYDYQAGDNFPCRVLGVSASPTAITPRFIVIRDDGDGIMQVVFADGVSANEDEPGTEWLEDFYSQVKTHRSARKAA